MKRSALRLGGLTAAAAVIAAGTALGATSAFAQPTQSNSGTTVVAKGADDPFEGLSVSVEPDKISSAELAAKGVTVKLEGVQYNDIYFDDSGQERLIVKGEKTTETYVSKKQNAEPGPVTINVTVERDGKEKTFPVTYTVVEAITEPTDEPSTDPTDEPSTTPSATPTATEEPSATPTETEEASKVTLSVIPEKITVADFRNKAKGTNLSATGCEPGDSVTFTVTKKDNSDLSFSDTGTADEKGSASVSVYAEGDVADSTFLGAYDVTASCAAGEATGTFTVVKNDEGDGGGSTDDKNKKGKDGSQLPRTGSELTALYGAGALLAIGGAALALSRRRAQK